MQQFQFSFEQTKRSALPIDIQSLIAAAETAARHAYAPYSRFFVGAALLLSDGTVKTGANQENAAFPSGTCAERAAVAQLTMNADTKTRVVAIAISYHQEQADVERPLSPCGGCRQALLEVQQWQQSPIAVYMCSPAGLVIHVPDAGDLLPFSFGRDYLNR